MPCFFYAFYLVLEILFNDVYIYYVVRSIYGIDLSALLSYMVPLLRLVSWIDDCDYHWWLGRDGVCK